MKPSVTKASRISLQYGVAIAFASFLLAWLEYRHATRLFSTEIYIVLVAVMFAGLGIWIGNRLTPRTKPDAFERNENALESLGITNREYDALCVLEEGGTNKEIARSLDISPNTVKTHLRTVFEKADVRSRFELIARMSGLPSGPHPKG